MTDETKKRLTQFGLTEKSLPILLFTIAIDKARDWLRGAEGEEDKESIEHYYELLETLKKAYEEYKEENIL